MTFCSDFHKNYPVSWKDKRPRLERRGFILRSGPAACYRVMVRFPAPISMTKVNCGPVPSWV